jgi:thiol:disulfide interchange protein
MPSQMSYLHRFGYAGLLCVSIVAAYGCSRHEVSNTNRGDPVPNAEETSASDVDFYTVAHYDITRNPADDLAATIKRAKAENKRILVQVGGDWCGWCKLMSRFIEANDKVREKIRSNYLVMKVTYDSQQPNEAFLSQYPQIPGYPHLFVLESDGKLLHSQGTAQLEEGNGYNEQLYLAFLDKWKTPNETPASN